MWKTTRDCRAHCREGQDLVGYALIIALIVILAIAALTFFGASTSNVLNEIARIIANVI